MAFEEALVKLKMGAKMYREGWLGPGQYVYMRQIAEVNLEPFFFICKQHPTEQHWPWVPTQRELVANDWRERHDAA